MEKTQTTMLEHETIKNHIEEILRIVGVAHDGVEHINDENGARFCIKTSDSHALIGPSGETLAALNHIIKRIVGRARKEEEREETLYVDVNGYQEQLFSDIKAKAKVLAERAKSLQANIEMEPMSSYERLFVHSLLSKDSEVKTESKGEGRNRRVVIKCVAL